MNIRFSVCFAVFSIAALNFALLFSFARAADVLPQVRVTKDFDNDWLFYQDSAENAENTDFNDAAVTRECSTSREIR